MPSDFVPGALVRHPAEPDWGTGQVQSVIGHRITVNFEHAGKRLINGKVIKLMVARAPGGRGASTTARAARRTTENRKG
jgi:hypothetical protein